MTRSAPKTPELRHPADRAPRHSVQRKVEEMGSYIERTKASKPREGFLPNPKLKFLDQVSEVMRFKHYSFRTETTYREWIRRFILFHGKRHPREMGVVEVKRFLSSGTKMFPPRKSTRT
jgi:hypothetical protein